MQETHRNAVTLVLGGARSGKTRYAQRLGDGLKSVVFIATAQAGDEEMRGKIARHQEERPQHWCTVEEPLDLAAAITRHARGVDLVIVDCLTLYASNLLIAMEQLTPEQGRSATEQQVDHLCRALRVAACPIVLVSNEVGSGIVPAYPLGRRYRELLGGINQRIAELADEVVLLVAGLPLTLKAAQPLTAGDHQ